MIDSLSLKSTNTILYCKKWRETVHFYEHQLGLSITFAADWFVEFRLTEAAHLSVADERRATIKSSGGAGLTLTLRVNDADEAWSKLHNQGLALEPVRDHAWGARVFYFFDPEGNRLEIWSAKS
ncbi:MAG: VOC family protein [Anaerolineae bacterium]|nr:VOC family protein [Anaerolineae bacterium]